MYFDARDEEIATAFSIYCGIAMMHSIVHQKIQAAQTRTKLSNDLMMYNMKVKKFICLLITISELVWIFI